jgi:hypothetical protein
VKGRPIVYSAAELAWLQANRTLPAGDYARAFRERFGRDVSAANLAALRKRKGWRTGRTGQFEKGHLPPNKGRPHAGAQHPNAVRTRFKKGGVPHTFRGAGHERIDAKGGYVVMIVAERNPWTGAETRPVLKHKWLWEQVNGPLPDGFCLKCLDGDRTNVDPSNWEAIPRALLPRLNGRYGRGFDAAPAELKPAILTTAKLENRLRERNKERP